MRFTTFAAFMLPLAALAAPTTSKRDQARQQFLTSLKSTGEDINMVIQQLVDFQSDPVVVLVLQTVQLVDTHFGFGAQASSRISDALQSHDDPSDAEYVDSFCAYTIAKNELTCTAFLFLVAN